MRLITHLTHLNYQIGFTGSSGFLLLQDSTHQTDLFFTDARYRQRAKTLEKKPKKHPFKFIEWNEAGQKQFADLIEGKTVEFESEHFTLKTLNAYTKKYPHTKWIPSENSLEEERKFKNKEEIKNLKHSQKINEKTLKLVQTHLKTGVTEQEIAWKIKCIGHDLGAEDISFEPIVAFGAHSATPHHENSTRKLKASDVVLIDMGMKYKSYCSDMTRTFYPKNQARSRKMSMKKC